MMKISTLMKLYDLESVPHLRTIMMASCSDLSVSAMNCSAPPRRMMVHVLLLGTPLKKLNRSPPT